MAVKLVPLRPFEYAAFVDRQIAEFAREKARAGHWRESEARERSRAAVTRLLPAKAPSPGHRVFKGVDADGRSIGWIWLGPPPKPMKLGKVQWLYQITVKESERGKGVGRALLTATEAFVAREGAKALYLNVFGWNLVARSLYESAGYTVHYDGETEFGMHKTLTRKAPKRAKKRG